MALLSKISITLLLYSVPSIFSMEAQLNELHSQRYRSNVQLVIQQNEKKLQKYLKYACTEDPIISIETTKKKLIHIKNKIHSKQISIVAAIQKKYAISDDTWALLQNIVHTTKNHEEKKQTVNSVNIQQDEEIPADLRCMLNKNLQKNNISPATIKINYNNDDCSTHSPLLSYILENNILRITYQEPGIISLNKNIVAELSAIQKEGLCISVVNQLRHNISNALFYSMVNAMMENDLDEEEFYSSINPIVYLSLLAQACQDKRTAQSLETFYAQVYDPLFSIINYKKLCKIDRLHRILEGLEAYALL